MVAALVWTKPADELLDEVARGQANLDRITKIRETLDQRLAADEIAQRPFAAVVPAHFTCLCGQARPQLQP
jgi:hypothetical protein